MNKLEKIKTKRMHVAKRFSSRCHVCHKPFGKNFHFHHKKYRDDEKNITDFDASSSIKGWTAYQEYILPIIESRPEDFALLCDKHHKLVEMLKRFRPERFERLVQTVRESTL